MNVNMHATVAVVETLSAHCMQEALQKSAAAGEATPTPPAVKVLTKRQKWQQKWQKRRKRRTETNSVERTKDTTDVKEVVGEAPAKEGSLKRHAVATLQPKLATKRVKEDIVGVQQTMSKEIPVPERRTRNLARCDGRRKHTDKEEDNFIKMVESYKLKMGKYS